MPISYTNHRLINLSNISGIVGDLFGYDRLFIENNCIVIVSTNSSPQKTVTSGYGVQIYSIGQ